jgi:NAD(P)-dependent dehydrogenase (short-subunit alcohol dehydrogenase family)
MPVVGRSWFITGCSRGLGRALVEEILQRGDRAAVTARRVDDVGDFADRFPSQAYVMPLDVTQPDQVRAAAEAAIKALGRIDVLVNNAGYGLLGAVEEVEDEEIRQQFETNFFGALNLTRALLPHMRQQQRGRILFMSSHGGFRGRAGFGIYCASKFAIEGLAESLALELAPLQIRVIIIEPGPFRTDWVGPSLARTECVIEDYADSSGRTREFVADFWGRQPGNPAAAAAAIADVVQADDPPLRLVLGATAVRDIRRKLESVAKEVSEWEDVANAADFVEVAN